MASSRNITFGGNILEVDDHGTAQVTVHPHPPLNDTLRILPYSESFTTAAGSSDMIVDGSSSDVVFSLRASPDFDIYVKTITLEIGDSGSPTLNKFGALPALTTGIKFSWYSKGEGEYTLHDGIKTNKEFIRLFTATEGIGTGVDSWLSDVSGGASTKSYLPVLDFAEYYGMPYGVRLIKGSTDEIRFTIRDAMAGLDVLNAIGGGQRI